MGSVVVCVLAVSVDGVGVGVYVEVGVDIVVIVVVDAIIADVDLLAAGVSYMIAWGAVV